MMADLEFRNARIWGSSATTLCVSDGLISSIGGEVGTNAIDAHGASLLPGFVDRHVHPPFAGMNLIRVWLHDTTVREEYLRIIAEHAAAHPGDGWITGGGWSLSSFPGASPRKEDLDAIVADRPVFLFNRDVHGAWVNSRALELAGITAATPDPPDGRYDRDPDGTPSGMLHEGAAYSMNDHVVPTPDRQQWQEALLAAQRHLHALGITAWEDAWVTNDVQQAYVGLGERLTARVTGCLWWERHRGLEQIEELASRRALTGHHFSGTHVKIMIDGTLENFTGALLEPYRCSHDNRGLVYVDAETLNEAVPRLDALGFGVHMHAIGDHAVRLALDAVERARTTNGITGNHHQIAHLQLVHPDDLPRFAALGVSANCQMLWACNDEQMTELTLPHLGQPRVGWQYPFGSLRRSGARLVMGSDWPVSTANPLQQIEVGMTRVPVDHRNAEPLLPDERIDLETAVTGFTAGPLRVGQRADLALLGADLADFPDGFGIGDVPIDMTVAGGRVVFDRSAPSPM